MSSSGYIMSLFVQGQMARTTQAIDRALRHLSSGNRVDQAQDDPAGMGIIVNLTAQVRGFTQAILNTNQAQSVLQVADSAMNTQMELLQRMRELAVQSATGTLKTSDRQYLDQEFQALYSEFQRLTSQTNFNGINLLDGSFGTRTIQVGADANQQLSAGIGDTLASHVFLKPVNNGTFQPRTTMNSQFGPRVILSGDLESEGNQDLVSVNYDGSVDVFRNSGTGTYTQVQTLSDGSKTTVAAILADVNGDGRLDLLAVNSGGSGGNPSLSVMLGKGDGTFAGPQTFAAGALASSISVADVNGDGKLDVAIGNGLSNTVSLLLGNGDGSFQSQSLVTAGNNPVVKLADLNGDGKADLITTDFGDDTVSVRIGNGDGTFKARTTYVTGSGPKVLDLGDINGDGKLDLVTLDSADNTISTLLGNGDGTFQNHSIIFGLTDPQDLKLLDVNKDGKLDLVTADGTDGTISIYSGKGDGTFAARQTYEAGANTRSVIFADTRGIGVSDLVTADDGDDTLSILLGNSINVSAIADVSVATQSKAKKVLSILSGALDYVAGQRAQIGAEQNRLSTASDVALLTRQNLSEALGNIQDVDIAEQMSELVRLQVLQKAQVFMSAQANLEMKLVLNLLKA